MSNTTYSSSVFTKPAAKSQLGALLREMFEATPLYIVVTAAKAAFAKR